MTFRFLAMGATAIVALSGVQGQAATVITPAAQAIVEWADDPVGEKVTDATSPLSSATLSKTTPYGDGFGFGAALVSAPTVGFVAGFAQSTTMVEPSTPGWLRSHGDADLSFAFTNDTGSKVHVYLDFGSLVVSLGADNPQASDGAGVAEASLFAYAAATLDGSTLLGNTQLFRSFASDDGLATNGASVFGLAVTGGVSTIACLSGPGIVCEGGFSGTLDLGEIDLSQLLEVSFNLNTIAYVDTIALPTGLSGSATATVPPVAASCGIACGIVQLRIVPVRGAVPEPSSWALMIAGLGIAGGALRRRRAVSVAFS